MHCDFACLLYNNHIINKLDKKVATDIIKDSVSIEKEFVSDALPVRLIGMNSEEMCEYIEFCADRLLVSLGLETNPKITIFGNSEPLKLIYVQRWLDNFRQPWEAYALTRRTMATPREGGAIEHFRFAYPPSESINNPAKWAEQVSKMGADSPSAKVWWIN